MGQHRFALPIRLASYRHVLQVTCWVLSCSLVVALAWGQEKEPEAFPLEEPKTLAAPVQLVPVEEAAPVRADAEIAPTSAPPVRLAPEPLPVHVSKARQIPDVVEGIRPASFQEITPGESTRADVLKKLGEPQETTTSEGGEKLGFKFGPFPHVEIMLVNKTVTGIVIHLAKPTAREQVVQELNLGEFEPVTVYDDTDRLLGEVYPERGLMFAFEGDAQAHGRPPVVQVVLERISAEPFLLRAERTSSERMSRRLADVRVAQQLAPDEAEAFAMAARLDQQCGRLTAARDAAARALEIDGDQARYRIVLADVNRQLGHYKEAQQAMQAVLAHKGLATLDEAEARMILGRLQAATPLHDYRQAMQETVSAIKLAAGETKSSRLATRTAARRLLIRAQLSLAEILSYGPWKQRHSVVPQWLASAEKAANEHIEQDGASREILLDLYNASLHCLLVLEGQGSPGKIADAAIDLGRQLIAASEDAEFHSLVEWKLGTGLWYAARVEMQQGNAEEALRLAGNAEALLASASGPRLDSPGVRHNLAQLHFLLGSLHAIQQRDSAAAMRWYDKALPHLKESHPDDLMDRRGLVGEQLVSIGIALWETGRRKSAVSITQEGADLIGDAVNAGSFQRAALAVPYQNLAEMYRDLGNAEQAQLMARKAAQYEPPPEERTTQR